MQKFLGIQWLRGIAALAVVLFHAAQRAGFSFDVGAAGVDVFFVVSGFIMWTVTANGVSPAGFMRDRIFRIVPLYWLASLAMAVGALLHLFPSIHLTMAHVVGSMLFIPHVSPSSGEVWPLLVQGWTLNFEMFFYAIFALVLFLPRSWHVATLMMALIVLVLLGLVTPASAVVLNFFADPIVLEFAAGVLLGWCASRGLLPGRKLAWALLALGTAAFGVAELMGAGGQRVLSYGLPALALVAGTVALERAGVTFAFKPAELIGDASYSIYLFHTFAISVVVKVLGQSSGMWTFIVGVLGATLVGVLAYLALERPIAHALKRTRAVTAPSRAPRS